ncbi:GNAT family N-acetyltransferase [Candidatus Bathyarchaeota archaeon]|nr:GNAT family N-acetyltransferase [Candidatus Bathyarchaeota archaeon]
MDIKKASISDLPELTFTLASAFDDDPVMLWCIRNDKKRFEALRLCFEYLLKDSIKYGEVTCTSDLDGCAMWFPPNKGIGVPSLLETLVLIPKFIRWMGISRVNRWITLTDIEAKYRPKTPHFYLAFFGVIKDKQRQGIGSALINYTLKNLDENNLPAYLESSNSQNNDFYKRHGFKILNEIPVKNELKMWGMWRDPFI